MLLADAHQIRRADQIMIEQYQFPGILLMETAGRLATERILALYPEQVDFLILVGPGNNGGDGLAIARRLFLAGKQVKILLSHSAERFQGDARINYEIVRQLPISIQNWQLDQSHLWQADLSPSPLLIDALLGTGIESALRGTIAEMIAFFRDLALPTVAIDLPSGMNASTGFLLNDPIKARHTLSFQLPKICHFITPAANHCGELHILDIEIWSIVEEALDIRRYVLDAGFAERHVRPRISDSHKGSFGHVLLIGGSRNMTGAICLSAEAVMRSGAGLCTVVCPSSCRDIVLTRMPEVMCVGLGSAERSHLDLTDLAAIQTLLKGKTAIAIGPGMGTHPDTIAFFEALLPLVAVPIVFDADALNILATLTDWQSLLPSSSILTPHPGEMRRLSARSDANQHRLEFAESMAQVAQATIVLKGKNTLIACPDGQSYVNSTGNAGMATAGSGDVLTGVMLALLGQGHEISIAASLAVYLHGLAGDKAAAIRSQSSLVASDIIRCL